MTNKEAIDQLRFDMDMILFDGNIGEYQTLEQVKIFNEDNYRTYLADETAIKALEKQEPKKPIFDNMKRIQCPICKHRQPIQHYKYCPFCSQRIDWNGFIEEVIGNEK